MRRLFLAALVISAPACAGLSAVAEEPAQSEVELARERDWIDRRVAAGEPRFPRVAEVPQRPDDVRSPQEFDAAIAELLAVRDALLTENAVPPADVRQPIDEYENRARELVEGELERFTVDRD